MSDQLGPIYLRTSAWRKDFKHPVYRFGELTADISVDYDTRVARGANTRSPLSINNKRKSLSDSRVSEVRYPRRRA